MAERESLIGSNLAGDGGDEEWAEGEGVEMW
jgi:hypothetical protein